MEARALRIYSSGDVPRLRYIAGIILGDILGLPWEIVTDKRKLGKHPSINYSAENISGCFRIFPDRLLFETGIMKKEIMVGEWKGLPVFFQTDAPADFPFDIFAASFYLVTRYEEYLDHQPDEHGRFRAESSLAFRNGFLGTPVVDLWARELAIGLLRKFRSLTFRRNEFRSLLTIDSHQPFAFPGKNILSTIGGLFRDLTRGEGHQADRFRSVTRKENDPLGVFEYISGNIEKYKADARFFFPVGDHSKFDKHPSWKNEGYRNLIRMVSSRYKSGLHPSYYACDNPAMTAAEAVRLKSVMGEVSISRFHSIRLFMPRSYNSLILAGITEDYSMGYPDEPGFRAGIARPYLFYNIETEEQTLLKIIPFQVTDSLFYSGKNSDPLAVKEVILKLIGETRRTGGTFVSIWHNTSLSDAPDWKVWREVFEFMLQIQVQ